MKIVCNGTAHKELRQLRLEQRELEALLRRTQPPSVSQRCVDMGYWRARKRYFEVKTKLQNIQNQSCPDIIA